MQLASSLQPFVVFPFVFFGEEIVFQVKLLAKGSFNHPGTIFKEVLEVLSFHNSLRLCFGNFNNFHLIKVNLLLALRTQLVINLSILDVLTSRV